MRVSAFGWHDGDGWDASLAFEKGVGSAPRLIRVSHLGNITEMKKALGPVDNWRLFAQDMPRPQEKEIPRSANTHDHATFDATE